METFGNKMSQNVAKYRKISQNIANNIYIYNVIVIRVNMSIT